jgi:hypothetical protein
VCVCVCVCVRARVCVCVCERERGRVPRRREVAARACLGLKQSSRLLCLHVHVSMQALHVPAATQHPAEQASRPCLVLPLSNPHRPHTPPHVHSGTSVKNMEHWAQLVRQASQTGRQLFRKYDYGSTCFGPGPGRLPRTCNQRWACAAWGGVGGGTDKPALVPMPVGNAQCLILMHFLTGDAQAPPPAPKHTQHMDDMRHSPPKHG